MKKLILLVFALSSLLQACAQITSDTYRRPPNPLTGSLQNNSAVWDANLYVPQSLRIPRSNAFTLNGAKDSIGYVMFNTTTNRFGVYRGSGVWDSYANLADTAGNHPQLVSYRFFLNHRPVASSARMDSLIATLGTVYLRTAAGTNQTINQAPVFAAGFTTDHFLVTGSALSEIQYNLQVDGSADIRGASSIRNSLTQYPSASDTTAWTHTVASLSGGYMIKQTVGKAPGTAAQFNLTASANGGDITRGNGDIVVWSSDPRLTGGGGGGSGGTMTSITPLYGFAFHTPITTSGSLIVDSTIIANKTYVQNYTYTKQQSINAFQPIGSYELLSNKVTSLDNSSIHYPTTSALQSMVTTVAGHTSSIASNTSNISANSTAITTLQGQHASDYAAIGLRPTRILSPDPGAPVSAIAAGDSLNMAFYKLQKQVNGIQVSGDFVDLVSTQSNIAGLKTFTTGVSSQNYTVTNSNGTSTYQIYNDSARIVVRPYNPSAPITGYDITQDLPNGYVTDGSVDYTSVVQAALNNHLHVSMPPFTVGVYFATATGLILQNGATVDFPTGAKLKMLPNNLPTTSNGSYNYGFFKMQDNYNITINNPVLEGDLLTHLPSVGAFNGGGAMSIYIFGGHDIIINGGSISNSGGDGIYTATSSNTGVPNHILINKTDVSHNGRNGISLTSCNYCLIQDPIANYEEKFSPYTGIDVEVNSNTDLVDHIVINNPTLLNTIQTANGIQTQGVSLGVSLYYHPGNGQTASTMTNKTVNVTVNNPTITGANVGMKGDLHLKTGDTNPNGITVTGQYIINNPRLSNNWNVPNVCTSIDANFNYLVYNPTLYDKNGVLVSTFSAVQAALYHNDDYPGTREIVYQNANPSPITTVAGVTIPAPVTTVSTTALYLKDNDIKDYAGNIFLKSNTAPAFSGAYANPSWITSLAFTKITGVPSTAVNLGLTDNFVYAVGTAQLTPGSIPYVTTGGKLKENNAFINVDDASGGIGLRTTGALPASLTFGNGATEYSSNVTDLITNTQYVKKYWSGNTYHISSNAAGTAVVVRPMQFDIGLGTNSLASLSMTASGFIHTTYSDFSRFNLLRVNGNVLAPTAVVASTIGSYGFMGWNGTGNSPISASMEAGAMETFTTTANGTELRFFSTPTGTTAKQLGMTLSTSGNLVLNNSLNFNNSQPVINGSTSGSMQCDMPEQGNLKRVVIRLNALVGSAVYTFPTAFLFTPRISPDATITGYTVTTTSFTANAGSSQTGYIVLEGF